MRKRWVVRFLTVGLVLTMGLWQGEAAAQTATCATGEFLVSGTVKAAGDVPIANATVSAYNAGTAVLVDSGISGTTGVYSLCLPPGTYNFVVTPPSGFQ